SFHSPVPNLKNSAREEETPSSKAAELQGFSNEQIDLLLHAQRERMADAACGQHMGIDMDDEGRAMNTTETIEMQNAEP
uniref:Uncharacterized protein n=1 Tax=Aegilops tauschii subsp. strangulata TaxID=200361 RepID=A0A453AEM4_AEGTS